MSREIALLSLLALVVLPGCGGEADAEARAQAYLDAALDRMEERSLLRRTIDWPALRRRAHDRAAGATTPAATYDAIRQALQDLGDRHSFFQTPDEMAAWDRTEASANPEPRVERQEDGIIVVSQPGHTSGHLEECNRYAQRLQDRLAAVDGPDVRGWILDLRCNDGGNMWPMIAGLAPLLGEGRHGAFVESGQDVVVWRYEAGVLEGEAGFTVRVEAPRELSRTRPVAVLIGPGTASSGEAVAIAFKGLERVRFFGRPTGGYTTSNDVIRLADGAALLLTVSRFADRTGQVYVGPVTPDVETREDRADDDTLFRATEWLLR